MRSAVSVLAVLFIFSALAVKAEIPPLMNYQGVLVDSEGQAVPDGLYSVTFRLYEVPEEGAHFWEETRAVTVSKGIFSVALGEVEPQVFGFEAPYWMGISVEGEPELYPRVQLTAAAYSFNTRNIPDSVVTGAKIKSRTVVRSLNGLTEDVFLVPGDGIGISLFDNFAPGTIDSIRISATGTGGISGTGSPGQIPFWSGTDELSGTDLLSWNNSSRRLGIGTPNPNARLRCESPGPHAAIFAADSLADSTQVIRVMYLGSGAIDAKALYAQSRPLDAFGIGGYLIGGWRGVYGWANGGDHMGRDVIGVHGHASGYNAETSMRIGVYGTSTGPGIHTSIGIYGNESANSSYFHYGAMGVSQGSEGQRVGVFGYASATEYGSPAYGIYGEASSNDSAYAVYADGNMVYTGYLYSLCDGRVKTAERPVAGALERLMKLRAKTYSFLVEDPSFDNINLPSGSQYGFIAQELEEVFPELVGEVVHPGGGPPSAVEGSAPKNHREPSRYKGVKMMEMIPILVRAVQEQQEEIEHLRAEVEELKGRQ